MWSSADSRSCPAPHRRRSPALLWDRLTSPLIIAKRHLINMSLLLLCNLVFGAWRVNLRGRILLAVSHVSPLLQVWQLRGVPAREAEAGGVPAGPREAGVWKGRAAREAETKSNSESMLRKTCWKKKKRKNKVWILVDCLLPKPLDCHMVRHVALCSICQTSFFTEGCTFYFIFFSLRVSNRPPTQAALGVPSQKGRLFISRQHLTRQTFFKKTVWKTSIKQSSCG